MALLEMAGPKASPALTALHRGSEVSAEDSLMMVIRSIRLKAERQDGFAGFHVETMRLGL